MERHKVKKIQSTSHFSLTFSVQSTYSAQSGVFHFLYHHCQLQWKVICAIIINIVLLAAVRSSGFACLLPSKLFPVLIFVIIVVYHQQLFCVVKKNEKEKREREYKKYRRKKGFFKFSCLLFRKLITPPEKRYQGLLSNRKMASCLSDGPFQIISQISTIIGGKHLLWLAAPLQCLG